MKYTFVLLLFSLLASCNTYKQQSDGSFTKTKSRFGTTTYWYFDQDKQLTKKVKLSHGKYLSFKTVITETWVYASNDSIVNHDIDERYNAGAYTQEIR